MHKQRVLLVCAKHLFSESMEMVLRAATGVELLGPWAIETETCSRISEINPNVVIVVEKNARDEKAVALASAILEKYPELPVIRANLTENIFRVFSMHSYPARGMDLLKTIRRISKTAIPSNERSTKNND
ncbi:MAG: hypothetical protein IT310_11210 [Anaerolineales bacterium]|nr:hypothetical protein [Anaerolineales bacterium]